jgi:hypothetical protein
MRKAQAEAFRAIIQKDMASATATHRRLTDKLGYKIDEETLAARDATLNALKRFQAILEQLEDQTVYRKLQTGKDTKVAFDSLPALQKRVQDDGLLDLQVLIDPKSDALSGIPRTIPTDDS